MYLAWLEIQVVSSSIFPVFRTGKNALDRHLIIRKLIKSLFALCVFSSVLG